MSSSESANGSSAKLIDTARGTSGTANSVLRMQRRFGNRYVQRVLALARQGEGEAEVTPDVESAIESARGGGQGLDHGVRRQMESAFGTDFGGVRVHTGDEAHELNHAVSAVAFTTGQDIFFRDGAYNPSNSEGKELLAHELTHVVQQNGAAPISGQAQRFEIQRMCPECEEDKKKQVQGKLTTGEPGDKYEQEAARVAREVVAAPEIIQRQGNPQASPQTKGTLSPGNAQAGAGSPVKPGGKVSATQSFPGGFIRMTPTVRCFKEKGSALEKGPDVVIDTPNQFVDLGSVTNGDRGFVQFTFDANWDFENPGVGLEPAKGHAQLITLTPFRVPQDLKADDDKLKFNATRPQIQLSEGTGAALDQQPGAFADADDRGGSVTIVPSITYQVQTANQLQGGFNVTVLFLSEGLQTANQAAVNETERISKSYTAGLKFQPKAVPPAPTPKAYDCAHGFGPFVVGSDRFMKEDDALQGIHDWYFGLDSHVRDDLEQGKGALKVTGRASTTGSKTFDLQLGEKRARRVRDIIADFAGSNAHLNSFALGEFAAQTGPNTEDPNERRVDVEASGQVPAEQAASVQGDGCGGPNQPAPTAGGSVTPSPDLTPPSGSGGAPAAGAQAAPQNVGSASSSIAEASTDNAGVPSGSGSQNLEEEQPTAGKAVEVAEEQTTQPNGATQEQQREETTA